LKFKSILKNHNLLAFKLSFYKLNQAFVHIYNYMVMVPINDVTCEDRLRSIVLISC